jgi:ACS family glucarate transporter-like MFS transporter
MQATDSNQATISENPGASAFGTTSATSDVSQSKVRHTGLLLVFSLSLVAYIDRSNLAVSTSTVLQMAHMTPVQMGIVSSVFSAAYAAFQIPGALFIRRVGTRIGVTLIVVAWSVFTLATGFAGGFLSLLLVRACFGVAEAPLFPALNQFNLHWFPVRERCLVNGIKTSGTYAASVITPPLTVFVLQTLGLKAVFLISGCLGGVAALSWFLLTRDDPALHPRVNKSELAYIQAGMDTTIRGGKVPWRRLFASRSFWGIGLTFFCTLYVIQFFLYWLPFFLQQHLHMSLTSMGYAASVPWIFIFVAALSIGRLSDMLYSRGYSLFLARNVLMMAGFSLAALFMFISVQIEEPWLVVLFISLGLGFAGFSGVLTWALSTDVGGEFTGVISAWMNMWGFAAATIMPTVSALIGTRFGWQYSVYTLVVAAIIGVLATLMIVPTAKIST